MNVPSGENVARRILPLDIYGDIRDDMVDTYIEAYRVRPPATDAFSKPSISELRDEADRNAVARGTGAAVGE